MPKNKGEIHASQLRGLIHEIFFDRKSWDNSRSDFGCGYDKSFDLIKFSDLIDAIDEYINKNTNAQEISPQMKRLEGFFAKYNDLGINDIGKRQNIAKDICALVGAAYEMEVKATEKNTPDIRNAVKPAVRTVRFSPIPMREAAAAASAAASIKTTEPKSTPAVPVKRPLNTQQRNALFQEFASKEAKEKRLGPIIDDILNMAKSKPVATQKDSKSKKTSTTRERPVEKRTKPTQHERHHVDRKANPSPEARRANASASERNAAKITAAKHNKVSTHSNDKPRGPKR